MALRSSPFVDPAPTLRAHKVNTLGDRVAVLKNLVWGTGPDGPAGSLRDPIMRRIGLAVTAKCPPRNDLCELRAIFDFIGMNVRYTGDIAGRDTFQKALRTLQFGGGDCLPGDTLLLVERGEFGLVPLRHVEPGQRIWGLERWSLVEAVWSKGRLPVDLVSLESGAAFRATSNHHVYVSECRAHHDRCCVQCPAAERDLIRVTVGELHHGDALPVPEGVPWGLRRGGLVHVHGVARNVDTVEVFDLTTDDHRVYLPEAHVTVSQCDDHAVLGAVLAMENGFYCKFRITSNTGATWDHIYLMAGIPKHRPDRWIAIDTTLGPSKFGIEPGRAKYKDFLTGTRDDE